jgi:hypothetical protein
MATTPPYLLGRDLTAVTVAGITVDANGVMTIGTPVSIRDGILEVDPSDEVELEDLRPVWSAQPNMVPIGSGSSLALTMLQFSNGYQALTFLKVNFRYCYAAWQQGTETFQGYYTIGNWRGGIKARGANPVSLEFHPCDPSEIQVGYSTA